MTSGQDLPTMLLRLSRDDERVVGLDVSDAIAGFHAQQSIEKALKAVLAAREVEFPHTHFLNELVRLLNNIGIYLPTTAVRLSSLNKFAVMLRYDDEPTSDTFSRADLQQTVATIGRFAQDLISSQP